MISGPLCLFLSKRFTYFAQQRTYRGITHAKKNVEISYKMALVLSLLSMFYSGTINVVKFGILLQ